MARWDNIGSLIADELPEAALAAYYDPSRSTDFGSDDPCEILIAAEEGDLTAIIHLIDPRMLDLDILL